MADRDPRYRNKSSSALQHRPHLAVAVPEGFRNPLAPIAPEPAPILLPLLGVEDDLTPALEALIAPVARRAQAGDRAARNALYAAFEAKLQRSARRIRVPFAPAGTKAVWDRDDVHQEAFLVFAALVDAWPDDIPFCPYLLANFPWRLRDTVLRGIGRSRVPPNLRVVYTDAALVVGDPRAVVAESEAIVETLASMLEPPLGELLRLRVFEHLTMDEAAARLGLSNRTCSRYWRTIRRRLGRMERA